MIALVGGQPMPNLIPIRHYRPDSVLLIYTERTQNVYERLKSTLQPATTVHGLETDSYRIVSIITSIQEWLDQADIQEDNEITFNFTGGTKAMAFAAYSVAQQRKLPFIYLESERKKSRVYSYAWNEQKPVPLNESGEIIAPEITLHDFLNVHLGPENQNWKEIGAGRQEGSPFEEALANTLRSQGYEVMVGIQALGQVDLDVVVRMDNQFGIIEAKSGKNGRKLDGIKQLNNASRQLGTYTKPFYAITVDSNPSHQAIVDASQIQVVSLSDYVPGKTTLSEKSKNKLIAMMEETLKG
jgi:Holliday junction resolvase